MANGVDAGARIAAWNAALLEQLLPPHDEPGEGVVLALDDETLRAVAEMACVPAEHAAAQLGSDVRLFFGVGQIAGFGGIRQHTSAFASAGGDRDTPVFLGLLCLCVLAASRMAPDESHSTAAYYVHLRELLDLSGSGDLEHMDAVPRAFGLLASWLDQDLEGLRGRLVIPESPRPPYVGLFVSQTVFRRRDREILSEFFAARMASDYGFDPLLRLRRWPGRHGLTRHALAMLDDDALADRVRAAIRSARAAWDGSVVSAETGARAWPATLRLLPYPPRLHLAAGNRAPVTFRLVDIELTLEPDGAVELPWTALDTLARGVTLGRSEAALRLAALGDTIAFELGGDGLERVEQPSRDSVWILTRDAPLQHRFKRRAFPTGKLLPEDWLLLRDVPVGELPGVERAPALSGQAPFALAGGLPLEPRVYLSGAGPLLETGELDELDGFLVVHVDGQDVGRVGSGDRLQLPGTTGSHEVVVGDGEWQARYHVETAGEPSGVGSLTHPLDGPRALRGGAAQRAAVHGDWVCGAAISQPYVGALPFLARQQRLVSIDRDGVAAVHERPATPTWFPLVGLDGGGRWELARDGLAWVVCLPALPSGRGWARQLDPAPVRRLDPKAAQVIQQLGAEARSDTPDAWRELVGVAQATLATQEVGA